MKVKRQEEGVSEVLGSILVLLITVTLFSSVFYYVETIPIPKEGTYSEFNANMKLVESGGKTYANITVENVGGESLPADKTMFIVVVDSQVKRHMLSALGESFASDNEFSQGEKFWYNSSEDGLVVTPESAVAVALYDKANMKMIWTATLHGNINLPGIVIGVMSDPMPIVLGKYASVKAIVFDPNQGEDPSTYEVGVDLSALNGSRYVKMRYAGNNMFETQKILFSDIHLDPRKAYQVTVYVKDMRGLNVSYKGYLYVSRGSEIKGADLFVDPNMVSFSDGSPTHMSDVTVSVTVQNRGGVGATFKLEVIDEYPTYPGGAILIHTNIGDPMPKSGTYSVAPAGQTTITFVWKGVGTNATGASMGRVAGDHHLIVKVIDVEGVDGSPEDDNYPDEANVNITVLPKILFVDADQAIEGTKNDVSKYYQYILNTCDYSYTTKRILGDTLLTYDGVLSSYDLVIWETGYYGDGSTTSAISQQQMSELAKFYDNGGALWIDSPEVSSNILNEYFHLTLSKDSYTGDVQGVVNGAINLTLPDGREIRDQLIVDRSTASDRADVAYISSGGNVLMEDSTHKTVAVYETNREGGKLVYFGFEFSRLMHYYVQNFIGYRVLLWLGNITGRVGVDVAVDDLLLSTTHPLYMQKVTITAVVSNNGVAPISTTVLLKIDGVKSPEIKSLNPNSTGIIPGNGGFVYVNFTWIPTTPGTHEIEVYVDPYNLIKETNEENNFLDSSILNNNIYVEFSTLVVYNTTYANANATDPNLSTLFKAFNDLGYAYQTLNVSNRKYLPGGYESGVYFSHYNLVIWAQAEPCNPGSTGNYIGHEDAMAIVNAVQGGTVGFMFVGDKMPEVLQNATYGTGNNLLDDLLGVQMHTGLTSGTYVVFGYNSKNSITNGQAYVLQSEASSGAGDIDLLNGTNAVSYGLLRDAKPSSTNPRELDEIYNEHENPLTQGGFGVATLTSTGTKAMLLPFDYSELKGIFGLRYKFAPKAPARQARAQLLFHTLKWFGQLEYRPELAVYEPEIKISSELPQVIVGHSYMLQATVHNYGSTGVSAVVRFYDDYEWIATKSVYVAGDNETEVEVIWTPMFASQARHLRVVVDPLNQVSEITAKGFGEILEFNNEAIKTVTVWYFWDNMEHGDGNWEHEATLVNINGETPLDFLARKDVSTNVAGDWDWSYSGIGVYDSDGNYHGYGGSDFTPGENVFLTNDQNVSVWTHNAAHTSPSAFWLPETPVTQGQRKPIYLAIVLDNSGSMLATDTSDRQTRWYHAQKAAEAAVGMLSGMDKVAIFSFTGTGQGTTHPKEYLKFTSATKDGKSEINQTIEDIPCKSGIYTPLFDTVAVAIEALKNNVGTNDIGALIVLTDGASNSDNVDETYAPSTGLDEKEAGIIQWFKDGNGMLGIPYDVFTVSIGNTPDGRMHAISATSTGHIHYGVVESDAAKLEGLFEMFVRSIVVESTGGIRASDTVSNVPFVVFSDGFRTANWTAVGYGKWSHHTYWSYTTGDWYYVSTSYRNAYLETQINPDNYLSTLPGSYSLDEYEISLAIDGEVRIEVSPDGSTWHTITTVSTDGWEYHKYVIPLSYVDGSKPFYLKIINKQSSTTKVDDVIVMTVADYTPQSVAEPPSGYTDHIWTNVTFRWLVTPSIPVSGASSVILTFWTKYWMTEGTNGAFIEILGSTDGTNYNWGASYLAYVKPEQPYTGNMLFSAVQTKGAFWKDRFGNLPYWGFNGRSGGGTFDWQFVKADLTQYISGFKAIRIYFVLAQYGGLTVGGGWHPEMGWYIDDVKVQVTSDSSHDLWRLTNLTAAGDPVGAHSGNYAWVYEDSSGNLPMGVDSALETKQIDLTSARNATLEFWIRFNLNPKAGLPPATVRVEVSSDNGLSWKSITYGVRIGWGSSGHGDYAGTLDNGETNSYGWVAADTLKRINCDLSGWAGQTILLRFRVVTNATSSETWDPNYPNDPHGVFIDDVFIFGESYSEEIPNAYIWT